MKILFLTPDFPYPPQQGGGIRVYHFIRSLAEVHRVSLVSFAEKPAGPEAIAHMRGFCQRVEVLSVTQRSRRDRLRTLLFSREPDMARRRFSLQLAGKLRSLLAVENFDLVQVESLEMAPYIEDILLIKRGPKPFIIFDELNVEYLLQQRAWEIDSKSPFRFGEAVYSLIQWLRLVHYEREALGKVDGVIAVSPQDAQILQALADETPVAIIPNGVDTSYFQSMAEEEEAIVFVGKMDFRPNIDAVLWFFHSIWPWIKRAKPTAELWVVGKNPSSRLQPLYSDPQVKITGLVPDVRPYLARAKVVVIPLRMGSGTRLKVLEAMAMGKAIVSTSLGCEGIDVESGQEVMLVDTADDFSSTVIQLLGDSQTRVKLGSAARQLMKEKYDWQTIIPLLESFYSQLLGEEPRVSLVRNLLIPSPKQASGQD